MKTGTILQPESLQAIATAMARERTLEAVLQTIVSPLAACPTIALARIWLIERGDICAACPLRGECPDQTKCLHLAASGGRSRNGDAEWASLEGRFKRFPLGARKVGMIGATGEAVLLDIVEPDKEWIVWPEWVAREGIVSFAGQPLLYRGEVLGVLAVFSRARISPDEFRWLRAFADQAAVAIANARAFEQINRLREQLELENAYLREEVTQELAFGEIIGRSPALNQAFMQLHQVAPTDANVLIQGESGTGKELVARAIHERSRRRDRPLIKVNCASIPRELFESEFFGHVKGSFTGAVRDRAGRFQLADGGTLFLDEVGEIPFELQGKLLRVLQEGEFERVGEEHSRRVDVRLIAATNRDLKREIAAGHFREDLYYRLAVFPITVPPLRERREDIRLLAEHFIALACRRLKYPRPELTHAQVELLQSYRWPGNIRELQNVIERALIISQGGPLRLELLLDEEAPSSLTARMNGATAAPKPISEAERIERERANILAALEQSDWKIYGPGGAAAALGINGSTLASRMKAMKIGKPGKNLLCSSPKKFSRAK